MIIKLRKENELIKMCRQMVIVSHYHSYEQYRNGNKTLDFEMKR
jgi:hypothetical protein